MESWIVATFTLGFSIFYGLSLIEKSVWPLIFKSADAPVAEDDIRFTLKALRRLTPLLPPSNGVVILAGMTLLTIQTANANWSLETLVLPIAYLSMMLGIVLIGKNPSVVFAIRSHNDSTPLDVVRKTIRKVGRHHHTALFTNLAIVLYQLLVINNL